MPHTGRWNREQKQNAAIIVRTGQAMGMSKRDIVIGLMTAMQESSLRNLRGGDRDSAGLFQQRPSVRYRDGRPYWGTYSQVTNATYATRRFFTELRGVRDRSSMSLTQAAQRVQRSAYPNAYARWETAARKLAGGGSLSESRGGAALSPNAADRRQANERRATVPQSPNALDRRQAVELGVAPGVSVRQAIGDQAIPGQPAKGVEPARADAAESVFATPPAPPAQPGNPGLGAMLPPGIEATSEAAPIEDVGFDMGDAQALMAEVDGGDRSGATSRAGARSQAPASGIRASVLREARKYLGTPYVWGGTSPSGFDCSGLIQYVYRKYGVNLPRVSYQQANAGRRVSASKLKPGDLIAWDNSPRNPGVDHIGIYAGNGTIIEAPRAGLNVRQRKLSDREMRSAWGVALDI